MDSDVEKLAENVENLQIKKKSPKNWSDLPVEMKTARLERILVDSKTFNFSEVIIANSLFGGRSVEISSLENGKESQIFSKFDCMENLAQLSAHILKIGNIIDLTIANRYHSFLEEILKNTDSIQVRKLTINGLFAVDSTVLLLSKCQEILDSVHIWHLKKDDYHTHRLFKLADLAKISNTRALYYRYHFGCFHRNQFSEIVTAFANRQNTLGTTVEFTVAVGEAILNSPPTPVQSGDRIPTSDPNIEIFFEFEDDLAGMDRVEMHFVPTEPKINDSEI